jgi:arylsulfatase A-like enzyme
VSGPALAKLGFPTQQRFPYLFHVVDWFPTLAELAGDVLSRSVRDLGGVSQVQG